MNFYPIFLLGKYFLKYQFNTREIFFTKLQIDIQSERLRGILDERNGRVLSCFSGEIYSGYAATLRVLSARDDTLGARHLRGY